MRRLTAGVAVVPMAFRCVAFLLCYLAVGRAAIGNDPIPTGTLAYTKENPARDGVFTLPIPGGSEFQVVPPIALDPNWSRDGNWIAYAHANGGVHKVHRDGSVDTQVTANGDFVNPTFNPDATKIAYINNPSWHLQIIDANAINGIPAPFNTGVDASYPSWSPDGSKIAFSNWAHGGGYNSDLFLYDLGSQAVTQITHHAAGEAFNQPRWSPDSTQLVCWKSGVDGDGDIWKMSVDGSNQVNLTPDLTDNQSCPDWSPDGQWIVYSDPDPTTGKNDIWAMFTDGSHRVNLTNTLNVNEVSPSFVPEPSTLILLGIGGISLLAYVWRRRKPAA